VGYLRRLFRATEEENRRTILEMLPPRPGARLLDLGAGDGRFTLRVAARLRAARIVALELVEAEAAAAAERGIEVHRGDLEDGLPFESETFDVVHANQVIEHVRRTDRLLDEVRRVLAPGGRACISTNNLASWHNVASLALGWQPMPMHVSDELIVGNPLNPERGQRHPEGRTHLRLFTGRALEELCAHHGLERISLRTAGYYPLPPRLARVPIRLDPLHGAFLVGMFEVRQRQGAT
jgi:methionine biosynthesis protein MetW